MHSKKTSAALVTDPRTGVHLGVIEPLDDGTWIAKRYGPGYPHNSAIFPDDEQAAAHLLAQVGMEAPIEEMKRFMDEAPTAGAGVDIKKLIEDGRP